MRKVKYLFIPLILILSVVMCMSVTACGTRLATPQNVNINLDNYLLSWSRVDNARGYQIQVTNMANPKDDPEIISVASTKVSYSLQVLEEGDYEIQMKATSGSSRTYSDSKWTDPIALNKDYYSGCTFSLVNNSTAYEITGWSKPADGLDRITIPDVYRDKPVIGIGENAFKSKSTLVEVSVEGENLEYVGKNAFYSCTKLEKVTLPDSVTEIGEGAFHSCRILENFVIPEGVTEIKDSTFLYCRALESIDLSNITSIGTSAFMGCNENLKKVTIPDTVTEMGEKAFADCSVLEEVAIGCGVDVIPDSAFMNDKALCSVTFGGDADGNSPLKEISEYAFYNCSSLEKITLPYGLETIGDYAFNKDTCLAGVNIPETVEKIGSYAFYNTALYSDQEDNAIVYVGAEEAKTGAGNSSWAIGFNENAASSDGSSSFAITPDGGDDGLDANLKGVADYAFYKMTVLATVEFPDNVQYIGDYAFYGCSNVTRVILRGSHEFAPDVHIGSYAFAAMTSLTNFRFNSNDGSVSGVREIGDHAFYGDSALSNVEIPSTMERIGAYAFRNSGVYKNSDCLDSSTNVVYVGSSSNKWVVGYNGYTTSSVALDSNTKGIAEYAFTRDTYLNSVSGMGGVDYIGEGAFYKCTNLTEVSVPEFITEIGDYTFYGCSNLMSIGSGFNTYFSYLESIGRSAFYECEKLTGLDLSYSSLKYIGMYAFFGCSNMEEIKFSSTLEEIDDYAFYKAGMTSVTLPDSLRRIGGKAFYKCPNLVSVDFGSGDTTLEIDDYAFYKCEALESISIPGRVKEIGEYAFYKCIGVTSLDLGDGVEKIGTGAFASLKISSLRIPESVKEIGSYAFRSCQQLSSVIVPSSCTVIDANAFYGDDNATLYMEADDYLPQWSMNLNSSYRPMIWGCTLSEDGTHVVSIKITEGSVSNVIRIEGNDEGASEKYDESAGEEDTTSSGSVNYSKLCGDPEWEGHVFLGWALTEYGDPVYSTDELDFVYDELGEVVLYAVWAEA